MSKKLYFICVICIPLCVNANMTQFTVGTVLFSPADINRECWSAENAALLTSRMLISNLMPHVDTLKINDDKFVTDIIDYFRLILEVIRTSTSGKTKHLMLLALTDTLGGYMKHLVLPISKYAYYAGNVEYVSVIKLYQLFDELKNYLRTNGNGWARPWKRAGRHVQAKAISLQSPAPTTDPCKGIIYYKHASKTTDIRRAAANNAPKGCSMEVPLPFFDSKSHPSAIAVPFKTFGLRNLESRVSAYILVKFYVAVNKCMASRNTNEDDVAKFNANVFSFIMTKVMPHLCDDKFYSAFGGVLRILETIKQNGNKRGKQLGNFNILPEIEDREPYPEMGEDNDDGTGGKNGIGGAGMEGKKTKNNLILLAALATIIIWFCLGAAFVCCRIRASKLKKEEQMKALKKAEEEPEILSENSKGSDSGDACKEATCPAYQPSSRTTINDNYAILPTTMKQKSMSTKSSTRSTRTTEPDSDTNSKPAQLQVHNVQYYPPSFACHTSMTGKVKVDSSTDDLTSREEAKRPYVFGYDFQTTSEESSPRETTDGENEIGGNMSK